MMTNAESVRYSLPWLLQSHSSGDEKGAASPWAIACWLVLSSAAYGISMGLSRSWEQAGYSAIKLPMVLILTAGGNGLLNGFLAPLLGIRLSLAESLAAVLRSFAVAAVILGGLAPVTAFFGWQLPSMTEGIESRRIAFNYLQIAHVAVLAWAGIASNLRLLGWLAERSNPGAARKVMWAWLSGNFLLGAQLAWIGRPYFGQPDLPAQFLRSDALASNFIETVFKNLRFNLMGY